MGLNIPDLDSKNFDTILQEALARLPSLAPEWTDYNQSDPGITVIELLSWLADIDYYRLNRVTDTHRRAFLKIAGIECGENVSSRVLLRFTTSSNTSITIPKGKIIMSENLPFVTEKELTVLPKAGINRIVVNDFSGEIEVKKHDFYPFGKHLINEAICRIDFMEEVTGNLTFYVVASEVSDETIVGGLIEWQYYNEQADTWVTAVAADETNGLINSGNVVLDLSAGTESVRCVLKKRDAYETPPMIREILLNCIVARQEKNNEIVLTPGSSGYVNQRFALTGPFLSNTLKVSVDAQEWSRVADFSDALPNDKVYMLRGPEIVFGDGGAGKIPDRGAAITCSYLSNEGSKGNVKHGSKWVYQNNKIAVHNDYNGWGGEDEKRMDEAFAAFQHSLNDVHRAVTAGDYETLAHKTPGVRLARAKAVADKVRNHVNVIVIPVSENKEPKPSLQTQSKVHEYLDGKRLLTTTVSVSEPSYTKVDVSTVVHAKLADPVQLSNRVIEALESFLHPVSGGKQGNGWEFGKSLYLSDLYTLVAAVEGVSAIKTLKMQVSGTGKDIQEIKIGSDTLIASGNHKVSVLNPLSLPCGGVS